MPSPESTAGHVKQARAARSVMRIHIQKKKPENNVRFRGVNLHSTCTGLLYLLLSRLYCRPRNYTGSCFLMRRLLLNGEAVTAQKGSWALPPIGNSPAHRTDVTLPRRLLFCCKNYTTCRLLSLDDAINRANGNALG